MVKLDRSWTLFLDRDGVINHERENDYVLNWSQFVFYDGVKEALKIFNDVFGCIVIITNQRCIGKGRLSEEELNIIHDNMLSDIKLANGRIDKIYYAPDLEDNSYNRKPNIGMALQAQKDFPSIDFSKSIMVGNKLSDMQFGRNIKAVTVFIATTNPEIGFPHPLIDQRYNSLREFSFVL